eukprot:4359062-Pyramimonas_sp.AAC.1
MVVEVSDGGVNGPHCCKYKLDHRPRGCLPAASRDGDHGLRVCVPLPHAPRQGLRERWGSGGGQEG